MFNVINSLELLNDMSYEEKKDLSLFCQERLVYKWDTLFSDGDIANSMYFLQKWSFWIFKNIEGKNTLIANVKAEEILWEMALFQSSDNTRMATAIALEDCVLIVMIDFSIKELSKKNPALLRKIQQIIEMRNLQNKWIK